MRTCPECRGRGSYPESDADCPVCDGLCEVTDVGDSDLYNLRMAAAEAHNSAVVLRIELRARDRQIAELSGELAVQRDRMRILEARIRCYQRALGTEVTG